MPRDIRSFFTVISKKSGTDSSKNVSPPKKKKQTKRLLDSDDEDIIPATPEVKRKTTKKPVVISSDSEDDSSKKKNSKQSEKKKESESPKKKKQKLHKIEILSSSDDEFVEEKTKVKVPEKKKEEPKLKPVNISEVFKNTPIFQSKVDPPKVVEVKEVKKSKSKKKSEKEKKVHADADFEKTLDDLDDYLASNADELERSACELLQKSEKENVEKAEKKESNISENGQKERADSNNSENQEKKNERKRSRTDSPERNTPKKKKIEHVDSGIDPGQEAHERKRHSAILYQQYLNRGTPKNLGMKELPKGKPTCLRNLCFLRTGVLDSLDSEAFEKLIKGHGGRIVQSVSKKVNYVVVGEGAGPAKLAKAEEYRIPRISEDELLDLILKKSGMEPKYCNGNTSLCSDDLDFEIKTNQEFEKEKTEENKKITPTKETKKEIKKSPEKPKKESSKTKSPEIKKKSEEKIIKPSSFYSQPSTSKETKNTTTQIVTQSTQPERDTSMLPLTEKYKPADLKAVIGQQGDKSNLYKLKNWLEKWHENQNPKIRKALIKPSPWAKSDDGAYFKCALLSGSPGVGKTTTATLVAKELGLDVVEFNASDTRSKRSLKEQVSQLLHTKTIAGFATGRANMTNNRVLLMDEVDGMAGNEDRGGMQELILLIKTTSVPIVCMCNDRNHQKMRSLVNYCFDLKFAKPRLEQIRGAMLSICFKEKIDISPQALTEVIAGTGCDVRQTLNHLSMLGTTKEKITSEIAEKEAKSSKKDSIMGPWEVCRTVFTKSEHKKMSVADKARLFFFDYSLGPLFVQENYLKVQPEGASKKQTLLQAALTASSLSTGDLIDAKIRKNNNWALLESEAFFYSVIPGHLMSGTFTGQINFPSWLGKNSKKGKFSRMLNEIQMHTRVSAAASKMAVRLDYLVPLRNAIVSPLKNKGMEGIDDAVNVMKEYSLLREDLDSLSELCSWANKQNSMNSIETKVKTAFTRTYNKQVTLLPFAPASGIAKKKAAAMESNDLLGEEEEISDDEKDDDIAHNAMIKVKKPSNKGKKTNEPATSKEKKNKPKKREGKKGK